MIKSWLKKLFGKKIIVSGYIVDGIKPPITFTMSMIGKAVMRRIDRDSYDLFSSGFKPVHIGIDFGYTDESNFSIK